MDTSRDNAEPGRNNEPGSGQRPDVPSRPASARLLADGRAPIVFSLLALIALVAFESYAITTALPVLSRDLHAPNWAPLAYAATLTASLLGMSVGGMASDRLGTFRPLLAGGVLFVLGVVVTVIAPTMLVFVLGRLLQGAGGGVAVVVLYVVIAREFPPSLHAKMYGMLSAAWLLPSFVGPLIAGFFVERLTWRWLFVLVGVVALASLGGLLWATRSARPVPDAPPIRWKSAGWAALAALGALALHLGGQLAGPWRYLLSVVALAVIVFACAYLLPRGTLLARAGVPRFILFRCVLGALVAVSDVYIPLYLQHERLLTPTLAGIIMAVVAIGWAAASWVQGRFVAERHSYRLFVIASVLAALGPASMLLVVSLHLPVWVVVLGNACMGAGMGSIFPQVATVVMRISKPSEQGINGSALQSADVLGSTVMLAITGAMLSGLAPFGFQWIYVFTVLIALAVIALAAALAGGGRDSGAGRQASTTAAR